MTINITPRLLQKAPHCVRCHALTIRNIAQLDNTKGNAGRPYYACLSCGTFACFDDLGGIHLINPRCECKIPLMPSRLTLCGGEMVQVPHALFYACAVGSCDFFQYKVNPDGSVAVLNYVTRSAAVLAAMGL